MEKKNTYSKWMAVVLLACVCGLVSCRAEYEVTKVEGTRVAMDATWDAEPDKDALALLEPYKAGVDSVMGEVKGVAAVSMDRFRPESPLSNLIADVLRQAAASVLGLCVLTLGGADLKELCANIAARGGEGVSGLNLVIDAEGHLLEAKVGGQAIDEGRTYTVGTIDFLAEGNDGMAALTRASQRQCPEGATLRGLFMDYVERETAAGRKIEARIEGRVVMKK